MNRFNNNPQIKLNYEISRKTKNLPTELSMRKDNNYFVTATPKINPTPNLNNVVS